MIDLDKIARRAALASAQQTSTTPATVSVLTQEEKLRELREQESPELQGSGGGLGFAAVLEARRDAVLVAIRRRAAVRASTVNTPSEARVARAKAEKAKRKKMKKRGR